MFNLFSEMKISGCNYPAFFYYYYLQAIVIACLFYLIISDIQEKCALTRQLDNPTQKIACNNKLLC